MRATLICMGLMALASSAAVVIDRVAVVVGKQVIKSSDIDRDLRVTEFLNHEALDRSAAARHKSAERLIDQQLIRTELATGGYGRATDANAQDLFRQILRNQYGGSESKLRAALEKYGLTEEELRGELLWQLTVLQFIQQRFQPTVTVADEEIQSYYQQHLAELKRRYPRNNSLEALTPKIRADLESQAVDKALDDWLKRVRQRTRIEYREGAFQ